MSNRLDSQLKKYENDPRTPCRYGVKCYQKNAEHLNKYKHPPKNSKRKQNTKIIHSKKIRLDDEPNSSSSKIEENEEHSEEKEVKMKECISPSGSEQEDNDTENIKECISPSGSEQDDNNTETEQKSPQIDTTEENTDKTEETDNKTGPFDPKAFIKSRFLLELPSDFYEFWEFCKTLKPTDPSNALKEVNLQLVGPYDVLAGKFKHVKKPQEDYLKHWRYYYDPPEFLTVLKGDDKTGYHIGYFYDSPDEPPSLLLSNYGLKDGVFTKMGDNIFAAVSFYLEELKKTGDPFKKMHVGKLLTSIKEKAEKLKLKIGKSEIMRKRENKVVARTFNKIGLVVPYNKKTQLGYRELAMNDKDLMNLLNKLEKAIPEQKAKFLSDLQPVLTYASIALDECDFGTGVKLGWELLFHGIDSLNSTIAQFLGNSYRLLKRDAFAKIAEAHMCSRKKGCNLSIV